MERRRVAWASRVGEMFQVGPAERVGGRVVVLFGDGAVAANFGGVPLAGDVQGGVTAVLCGPRCGVARWGLGLVVACNVFPVQPVPVSHGGGIGPGMPACTWGFPWPSRGLGAAVLPFRTAVVAGVGLLVEPCAGAVPAMRVASSKVAVVAVKTRCPRRRFVVAVCKGPHPKRGFGGVLPLG